MQAASFPTSIIYAAHYMLPLAFRSIPEATRSLHALEPSSATQHFLIPHTIQIFGELTVSGKTIITAILNFICSPTNTHPRLCLAISCDMTTVRLPALPNTRNLAFAHGLHYFQLDLFSKEFLNFYGIQCYGMA